MEVLSENGLKGIARWAKLQGSVSGFNMDVQRNASEVKSSGEWRIKA